jgi:hypothetical protein
VPIQSSLEQVQLLKKQLYSQLNNTRRGNGLQYLLQTAKQPISSLHLAAVQVLAGLASQRSGWGLTVLFQGAVSETAVLQSDFFVYLENRLTESNKEGKDMKFMLIQSVVNNPSSAMLPGEVTRRLQHMVAQGPYYIPPAMEELQTL